jgi:two-component system response regulator TctD
MRILVVEDTVDVAEAIVASLTRIGHVVDWEAHGARAEARVLDPHYDLLVLDIMLPGVDGFELLRQVRAKGLATSVLMLTACAEIEERVHALDLGADDYLVKPFDYRELDARIRMLLRRGGGGGTNLLVAGKVSVDRKTRSVLLDGRPLELMRREVTLLEILLSRPGRIFGKDELIDRLFTIDDNPTANAVEQYVGRLRKKLVGAGFEIRTLRGLGYQVVLA